jgi:anthranilate synthase component 1
VHDSVEEDEYYETINKLKGNTKALEEAERYWYDMQQAAGASA